MRNALLALFFLFIFGVPARAQNDHVRIAEQNAPAIVAVNVIKADGSTFTGTGFVLTPDGLVATTRHVTKDALYINLTFNTGAVSGEAVPVAQAGNVDLALLQIHAKIYRTLPSFRPIPFSPAKPLRLLAIRAACKTPFPPVLSAKYAKKPTGFFGTKSAHPFPPVPAAALFLTTTATSFLSFSAVTREKETKTSIFPSPLTTLSNWLKPPGCNSPPPPRRKMPRPPNQPKRITPFGHTSKSHGLF